MPFGTFIANLIILSDLKGLSNDNMRSITHLIAFVVLNLLIIEASSESPPIECDSQVCPQSHYATIRLDPVIRSRQHADATEANADSEHKRQKRDGLEEFVSTKSHVDDDLREKESTQLEGFIPEEGERTSSHTKLKEKEAVHEEVVSEDTEEAPRFRGNKETYCDNYEQHFSFYCVGEGDEAHQQEISKFCPAYKAACPNKSITKSVPITVWPADPFNKKVTAIVRSPASETSPFKALSRSETEDEESEEEPDEQQLYYTELKRRFPCKPDCDHRIFPHCTTECKCDYIYPSVQRFCNPPPMPMFLNTCRLWYNGCPRYDQYHYASQFVYSKAEKNKVAPGPQTNNPNPYNIPTGINKQRAARSDFERPASHLVPLEDVFGEAKTSHRHHSSKRRRRVRKRMEDVTSAPVLTKKQLWQTLKALNGLTSGPSTLARDKQEGIAGPSFLG